MKKYMKIMCVMLIITCLMHLGIYAAANLQKITAYLNYDIAVKLDGNGKPKIKGTKFETK